MTASTPPRRGAAGGQWTAIVLLITTGGLISCLLASAEAVRAAGASALSAVVWQALGGGLVLAALAAWSGPRLSRSLVSYGVLSGLTAIAIPNLMLFWLLAEISAGRAATALAATPIMTALIALVWLRKPLGGAGWAGVALGSCGVALISGAGTDAGMPLRVVLVLGLVALTLSFGNVYRSARWPEGANIVVLAAAMKLGVGVPLAAVLLVIDPSAILPAPEARAAMAALVGFSAAAYLSFFALQRHGGPVVLSMIGGVIAFFGGVGDWLLSGVSPGIGFLPGLALLATGVLLASRRRGIQ